MVAFLIPLFSDLLTLVESIEADDMRASGDQMLDLFTRLIKNVLPLQGDQYRSKS